MKSITRTILFCLLAVQFAFAQERPNIVYILCDDLGYGDVSSLNPDKGKIPTPEIDALANQGMTFTDAHSGSSVCTPTRYGILTGRYAWRSRLQEGVLRGGDEFDPLIAEDQLTVPQMLKKVGYTTAAMGKWHLGFRYLDENGAELDLYEGKKLLDIPIGSRVSDGPTTRGFDSYIGFHHSASMKTVIKDNKVVDHMPPIKMLQFLGDHATTYLKEKAEEEQPFFLYLALNSPHSPVVPSEPWQGKSGMGSYADFVMETDDVVGRVLKALKENGIAENTLVFFASDNGCSFPVAKGHHLEKEFGHYPSANFRGAKSDIWEGGHRIPLIVSWPGKIKANSQSEELVCLTSLMATCAELTGAPMTEVDGEDSFSILPILRNPKAKSDHEAVVHHSINGKFSIRKGKWKLELTPGSGGWSAPTDAKALEAELPEIQLYNLKRDEEETTNVYHKYPKVVKRLTAALTAIVENGRSTPGKKLQNDVRVDIYKNAETTKQPVDYIDPSIGTVTYGKKSKDAHGFGKTFPGAATPFGLVQLSPDTYTGGDNGSGYSYEHPTMEGFSFTHMSGVGWFGDLGNFLVTPTSGPLYKNRGVPDTPEDGYRSRYSHDTEIIEAGYYAVTLEDYQIRAELTAAPRAGIIRFTFPENKNSRIQIDLARRVGGTSTEQFIEVIDEQTIAGWMKCPPEGGGWGAGAGNADYVVYFYCQFSKPLKDYGVWSADLPDVPRKMRFIRRDEYQNAIKEAPVAVKAKKMQGKHLGFYTEFETAENEVVLVKSGISFVDIAGAKANLAHDINHWNFDQVKEQARNLWNQAVQKIAVEGGTEEEKTIFYSALYHTLIDPRTFSDVNGNYIGADKKVHQTQDFTYRTIFSGWDVFRSQFPLQTIINPELVNDEVNSLLQMAELSGRGYLPRWELLNAYSGCMLGNPAVSVIVDAYQKGIRNYDVEKAFVYAKNTVDNTGNGTLGYSHKNISKTLEYAYTDWALGTFAESLGKKELSKTYLEKGKNYQNIWNDEVDWFRAKDSLGTWLEWKGKTVHGQGCIESNPFQQGWFVPHDIDGLKKLMGGEEAFKEELISFFEQTPEDFLWNNYYNHPNEPVHHVPFMFNTAGVPHLTQKWTRKICSEAYGTGPYGLCGNEDVGQMSAWYILAAMGIHPICPGDNKYEITSPVFNEITIQLDQHYNTGKQFKIMARDNSKENIYIQQIKLNGEHLDRFYLTHQEITNGGTLELKMGPNPQILK